MTLLRDSRLAGPWLWVASILVVVLAIYWKTVLSMASVWQNGTYSHGLLVFPIFLWLVWDRRDQLSRLPIKPAWPWLLGLAAAALVWLSGQLAAAPSPAHFALVAMVPMALGAILGAAWMRALMFPLLFLFFAVPFGEFLIPRMMDLTGSFTVAALKLSGIPVYREGNNFSLPDSEWTVIDACSGVRYLGACAMVATLYAWWIYRSNLRRVLFVGAAMALALIANWIRAYAIVMLAYLSDNRLARGVDHFIYGFVLFGILVGLIFLLGIFWRELPAEGAKERPSTRAAEPTAAPPAAPAVRCAAAAVTVVGILLAGPLAVMPGRDSPNLNLMTAMSADIEARAGWVKVDTPAANWQPKLSSPAWERVQTFAKDGQRVSVFLGGYGRPTPESKLFASVNRLTPTKESPWKEVRHSVMALRGSAGNLEVEATALARANDLGHIAVWHWYWVDGLRTISPARAALQQMLARLQGRSELSAWVAVFAEDQGGSNASAQVLERFLSDMLAPIDEALRNTASSAAGA